jgi:hypothetical protein
MLDIDSSDHPFECAPVLPEQFFADRHKFGEPIERLMFAILNDTIRCYQTNVGVQRLHTRRSLAETIEFRIIYLQWKQLRLLPEAHHQGGSAAHSLDRATRMQAQLGEGARAEVG